MEPLITPVIVTRILRSMYRASLGEWSDIIGGHVIHYCFLSDVIKRGHVIHYCLKVMRESCDDVMWDARWGHVMY